MSTAVVAALFTALAVALIAASFVVLYRGIKRFEPTTRRWLAGFFEQGTAQSSTRLVGISSFMVATLLCALIVVALLVGAWLNVTALATPSAALTTLLISVLTLLLANACVALGLRKAGDTTAPADTDHGPLVTSEPAPTPPAPPA